MSFEDKNFLHHYRNQEFQESDFDPFVTCNVKRKCLAQTFHASIRLASNETTCSVLKKNLLSYSEIVDKNDPESVNNYAKSTLALVSHCVTEQQQWKSGLHLKDPDTYIKRLKSYQCNLQDESEDFCTSSEVTTDDITLLLNNLPAPLEVETKSTLGPKKTQMCAPLLTSANVNKNTGFFGGNNIPNRIESAPGNNFNKQGNNPPRFQQQPQIRTFNSNQSFQQQPQTRTFNNNQSLTISTVNKYNNPDLGGRQTSTKPLNSQGNFSETSGNSSAPRHEFKTAREELGNQNLKKWGNRGGNTGSSGGGGGGHNYGEQKKSLGTRRGGFNKFIPPIRPDNDDEYGVRKRSRADEEPLEEEVDERLKNIDPKMVELIRSEIMDSGAAVAWDDIAGLEYAKATIQEIVVWPLLRPDIFTGLRRPPKGILLFGPPGTGKTLIGKCIASQSRSTFFSISASSLTSKWIGDGEKMVRALFAVARCHQPAVVFIDEIDSMLTQRSDTEHESSRRIKTEFLVQLDGATTGDEERILVVGATNRPQELDEAARRRLVKRLYIPLPETAARRQIVDRLMSSERHTLTGDDIDEVARLTDGYSGSDMKNLCQEASLGPIRSLGFSLQIEHIQPDQVRGVEILDFKAALNRVRASVSPRDLDSYIKWDMTYGSGGIAMN